MTAPDPRLGEIQSRLSKATPGPWRWDESYGDANDTGLALTNDAGAEIVGAYNHHCCPFRDDPIVEDNDAEFIAAAPADVAYLLAELRKAQDALGRVEGVAAEVSPTLGLDLSDDDFDRGWHGARRVMADALRAAVADATGGDK